MILPKFMSIKDKSPEERAKDLEYKKYIDKHISNVKKAWNGLKNNKNFIEYLNKKYVGVGISITLTTIDALVDNHDASKYSDEEWDGYRKEYYPVDDQEKIDNKANHKKAWEHHYTVNLHHWDGWAKSGKPDTMPFEFVVEMCCDWIAMSMVFPGDAYHWYKEQKDIILGKEQKIWVEDILKIYYGM